MSAWRTKGSRTAFAAGLGIVMALTVTTTAMSAPAYDGHDPEAADWGTVVKTPDGVQSHAWVARIQGLQGVVDAGLFQSHYPTIPNAPAEQSGGKSLIDLAPTGLGIGKGSALYSRAMGNKFPATSSGKDAVPAPGVAYADAGGAAIDVGIPYIQNPAGGTQLSPLGLHVEGITVSAMSVPGKPVHFTGGAARASLSSLGADIIKIPPLWPVNFGARIPADYSKPAVALATTNEQVTTDTKGRPTLGKDKHYQYDPKATSGYVNAIHASVLGTEVADVTLGHAAVIRDASLTDKLKDKLPLDKLPKLPDFGDVKMPKLPDFDAAKTPKQPAADAPTTPKQPAADAPTTPKSS